MRTRIRVLVASASLVLISGCTPETPTSHAAETQPAISTSTAARPAPKHVGRPLRVLIPAIGVDEALYGVGLKPDGAMQTPDFGDAGWYDRGPRPGARGPAVIVAHVHGPDGDDVFADLADLRPGDLVTVRRTDGTTVFVIDSIERSEKEALPVDRIWNHTQRAELRLITCGGKPDPVTRMYPDNTVVYAHAVSDVEPVETR